MTCGRRALAAQPVFAAGIGVSPDDFASASSQPSEASCEADATPERARLEI